MDKSGTSLNDYKISDPPSMLAYPIVDDISKVNEMDGQFVYVLKAYPLDGLSVVIHRRIIKKEAIVNITFGDWDGNVVDLGKQSHLSNMVDNFMNNYSHKFVTVMRTIQLSQAQFYIVNDSDLRLVDVRMSINKRIPYFQSKNLLSRGNLNKKKRK